MDPRIGDFISKNRKKYTREAIRQQLIDAGHDPADVDATWAALDTPDPDEASLAGEGFWSRFFLFLIGLNVAVFVVVALTTGMFVNLAGGGGALLGVFAVALGIGALLAWGIVAMVGPAKLGRTTALVIGGVIPIVFALLIGGSCFALASAIGPPPLPAVSGEMEVQLEGAITIDGTGRATCQPQRDATGYSVYGEELGAFEGRPVLASVYRYEAQVGEFVTQVTVSLLPRLETDPGTEWFTGPGTRMEEDVAPDGLSGMVAFENLGPMNEDPAVGLEPISGTITWTCEGTAP